MHLFATQYSSHICDCMHQLHQVHYVHTCTCAHACIHAPPQSSCKTKKNVAVQVKRQGGVEDVAITHSTTHIVLMEEEEKEAVDGNNNLNKTPQHCDFTPSTTAIPISTPPPTLPATPCNSAPCHSAPCRPGVQPCRASATNAQAGTTENMSGAGAGAAMDTSTGMQCILRGGHGHGHGYGSCHGGPRVVTLRYLRDSLAAVSYAEHCTQGTYIILVCVSMLDASGPLNATLCPTYSHLASLYLLQLFFYILHWLCVLSEILEDDYR